MQRLEEGRPALDPVRSLERALDCVLQVVAPQPFGIVTQSPPGGTGTYALDADCKGTLQFTPGPSFDIFVARKGRGFWMIQTNPGNVFQGSVKKVS